MKDNSELSEQIRKFYLEILEREPSTDEIESQIHWLNQNRIDVNQLPLFFKQSLEYETLKIFKEIGEGPIKTRDDVIMYLNPKDNVLSRSLAYNKIWEPFQTSIVKKFLRDDTVMIDIGANIGYYSLLCAAHCKHGSVISFEPEPLNYDILIKNISVNNFVNIKPYRFAISNKNGNASLYIDNLSNAGDHRLFGNDLLVVKENRQHIQVSTITLDGFFNDMVEPDVIKMDIQGSEMLALEGMKKTLNGAKRMIMLTEFWPRGILSTNKSPATFLIDLENLGFEIYEINDQSCMIVKKSTEQLLEENTTNSNSKYIETSLLCLKNISL